ncbi:hypothetical protein FOQG_19359 [Fusarium oxysporum f. sp. raphani 54005]|uniref:Uncharacterized protein n=1 Tax=Fusarium oxysporum f. sp. raphani 54005 TaxID=1089458 RepID=X0B2A0_FUSOX|nr:hypothetical protein FOQG_19359 [Fusarium oxysporum f. sp. raphani 54005]
MGLESNPCDIGKSVKMNDILPSQSPFDVLERAGGEATCCDSYLFIGVIV